eukprot:COSAG06_NODE_8194_length_2243_cov_4.729011_1_plen_150_part_00
MHCKRQGETERDRSKALGVSTRARDLHTVLTRHTHTHPTHPSKPTSTAAPSQPAVWPCQMTYDTQHLRPIGGGALSNAHSHTDGEGAASTQTASQHALQETGRQIQSTGVSALEQETYILSSPDAPTHPSHQSTSTSTQQHSQPAVWYR